MEGKAQSSMELMITYGVALLIIIIVVGILYYFTSVQKAVEPARCSIYGGINCLDVAYSPVTYTTSQLEILGSDTQPGVMNITGFSATVNNPGINGYCTPNVIQDGNTVYCVATLPSNSTHGKLYTGTATINAIYCPSQVSGISHGSCTLGNGGIRYSFAVSFAVEGSPINTVPTTISIISSTVPPQVQLSAQPSSPTTIFIGQSIPVNALASGGTGSYTYRWTSSSCPGAAASGSGNTYTYMPNGLTFDCVFTFTANDIYTSATASTAPITVASLPIEIMAYPSTPTTIYVNQQIPVNAIAIGGTGSYMYSWISSSCPGAPASGLGNAYQYTPSATTSGCVFTFTANDIYTSAPANTAPITVIVSQPACSASTQNLPYICFTITNSQSSATPVLFQQMITFKASTYSAYEAHDLGNIRFYQGSNELDSWCESGCTSTSTNSVFWVKLSNAIPAGSSANIIGLFELEGGGQYEYNGIYAGEAPQLSAVNGEYDNGNQVFITYWNDNQLSPQKIEQNNLPSGWVSIVPYTQDGVWTYDTSITVSPPIILEALTQDPGTLTDSEYIDAPLYANYDTSNFTALADWDPNPPGQIGGNFECISRKNGGGYWPPYGGSENGVPISAYNTSVNLMTLIIPNFATQTCMVNYANPTTISYGIPSNTYYEGVYTGADLAALYWYRSRAYPPNGVMPSVSVTASGPGS